MRPPIRSSSPAAVSRPSLKSLRSIRVLASLLVDLEQPNAIRALAQQAIERFPRLNVLVNNAGIMRTENFLAPDIDLADAEATVVTNLLGPIRLTSALLPHLRAQPRAAILTVSSGLAFVPRADTPTYCATKAAIHSYSQLLLGCSARSRSRERRSAKSTSPSAL